MDLLPGLKTAALLALAFLAIVAPLIAADPVSRQWHDANGRSIVATLVAADEDRCTLRRDDGRTFTLALSELNAEDREYVRGVLTSIAEGDASLPAPQRPWPKRASAGSRSRFTVVSEARPPGESVYRSRHFELHSDIPLPSGTVKEFTDIFEATLVALTLLPMNIEPEPPVNRYQVSLFIKLEDYGAAGGIPGSAGSYNAYTHRLLINLGGMGFTLEDTRLRTDYRRHLSVIKHEAAHLIMATWMQRMPVWMTEGWAEYIAAMPYDTGTYHFSPSIESMRDYINKYRPGADRKRIAVAPLDELMKMSYERWGQAIRERSAFVNYHSAAILMHYFLQIDDDGEGTNVTRYMESVGSARNHIEVRHRMIEAEKTFLLRGRTHGEIAAEIAKVWKKNGVELFVEEDSSSK